MAEHIARPQVAMREDGGHRGDDVGHAIEEALERAPVGGGQRPVNARLAEVAQQAALREERVAVRPPAVFLP
jgi:hypothetical protein